MMCRLEMVSMGKFIFRSGHLIDRTKQLDKLAFTGMAWCGVVWCGGMWYDIGAQ